jgi:hypothetical protein
VYLRRGLDGEAIAWPVSDGICTLQLDGSEFGGACKLTSLPHPDFFEDYGISDALEDPIELVAENGHLQYVEDPLHIDPDFSDGTIPGGFGPLFVGVSLYMYHEGAQATLAQIQLH